MDQGCIFCQIARGDAQASIVYEDGGILAFMNRFQPVPAVPGHVLVVPRAHVENIYIRDDALACSVFVAAGKIARAVKQAFPAGQRRPWKHGRLARPGRAPGS